MANINQIISIYTAIFPAWVVAVALGFIVVFSIIIVVKVVTAVLNAIPFL